MNRLSLAVVLSLAMLFLLAVGVVQAAFTATFVTQWGSAGTGDGQFNGATSGNPTGVAIGLGNDVYVVDTYNYRIQQFHADGTFVRYWGSFGTQDSQFNLPHGVATDGDGHVYVTDSGNGRVQVFNADGTFVRAFSAGGFPAGIAVGPNGNVYVTEMNGDQVKVFTPEGSPVTAWGSFGTDDGEFNNPVGIAVDYAGQVYVAEQESNRVQLFNSSHQFTRKWGSPGSGDGQFNIPKDVEVDADGLVYVVDSLNNRVQIFDSNGAVAGKWGSYGAGNGELNVPMGIAVDGPKRAFVTDGRNHRVEVFRIAESGVDTTSPTITVTTPKNYAVLPLGTTLSFTAADEVGGSGLAAGSPKGHLNDGSTTTDVDSGYQPGVGIYTLVVSAADKAGNSAQTDPLSFVVFDPTAGFVTGGGWFDSPINSEYRYMSTSGEASFGFVAKYLKGTKVPSGETDFRFGVANLDFYSQTYQWLVVNKASSNAQFKGEGTINGVNDVNGKPYKFLLWATDGSPDRFRIKIWWEDAGAIEHVVYDNGTEQAIGGGSIIVHSQ